MCITVHLNQIYSLFVQVEGLLDDMDFKAKVTRVEFETLCADLFERVPGPVQDALSSAEMSLVSHCSLCAFIRHQMDLNRKGRPRFVQ